MSGLCYLTHHSSAYIECDERVLCQAERLSLARQKARCNAFNIFYQYKANTHHPGYGHLDRFSAESAWTSRLISRNLRSP